MWFLVLPCGGEMVFFEFAVNSSLELQDWNDQFGGMGNGPEGLKGRPYYELFPRICQDRSDSVASAIESGRALSLPGYRLPCFYCTLEADVFIQPICVDGLPTGARVRVEPLRPCTYVDQVQQSRKLVDIGKTASILSHGVRNPLNAIKGAVVYLKNRYQDDADLLEFTGIMEEEISRLDHFISGFLSTSFPTFDQDKNDINRLLKKLELYVSLQARAAGIELVFNYGPVPLLTLNVFQIEHAILNILNNAINAMVEGGRILVESRVEDRGQGLFVVVDIVDNGPGMTVCPAEDFASPLDNSPAPEGRGFGLFITREVLRQHGGTVEIQSSQSRGTRVRLLLPAAIGEIPL